MQGFFLGNPLWLLVTSSFLLLCRASFLVWCSGSWYCADSSCYAELLSWPPPPSLLYELVLLAMQHFFLGNPLPLLVSRSFLLLCRASFLVVTSSFPFYNALTAKVPSSIQPMIKASPPIGVMAPS